MKCFDVVSAEPALLHGGAWTIGVQPNALYHWARNRFAGVCGAILGDAQDAKEVKHDATK